MENKVQNPESCQTAVSGSVSSQINNKMDYKDEAQKLINYSMNLLSIQYNSDGVVMKRSECLPKARMIARSHISFSINQGGFAPHLYDYWKKVEEELDMCL